MGFSSWKGRYRGVVGRGRSPQPGRSCVPPAAFPSRGAGPPLQSGVPVRRELSVQHRPRRTAVPSLAVTAVAPALGRTGGRWQAARPCQGPGARLSVTSWKGALLRPDGLLQRVPTLLVPPPWAGADSENQRTDRAPRALIISSAAKGWLRPRPTLGKLPVCDPSRRSPLSPGSGAQRPGRLPSPRGARPSLLPAAEVGGGRRSQDTRSGLRSPKNRGSQVLGTRAVGS